MMKIKVSVTGSAGEAVEKIAEVTAEGQIGEAVLSAMDEFRNVYPNAERFAKTIRVDSA